MTTETLEPMKVDIELVINRDEDVLYYSFIPKSYTAYEWFATQRKRFTPWGAGYLLNEALGRQLAGRMKADDKFSTTYKVGIRDSKRAKKGT